MSDQPVEAVDDLPHAIGAEPDYSESFYYQFGDPAGGLNGFLRLSNRPNEGRGERTVCLYLPDGRVALSFDRPTFADPLVFEAGGMQIIVDDPLVLHRVTFSGEFVLLADGWAMDDPKAALGQSPREDGAMELEIRATAPARHFSLDEHGDFTPHHYEQFVATRGVIRIAGDEIRLQAHGMRDRGWGPRSWQAPRFYRWLFGSCNDMGFAAGVLGRDGGVRVGGFVWDEGAMRVLDNVSIDTCYDGTGVASVGVELVADDRSWSIIGQALNAVPLRHRRRGTEELTRILETSVLWSSEGREMLGIAEYLDQIVDGEPVGIVEHDLAPR
jgi:hypothetical protein